MKYINAGEIQSNARSIDRAVVDPISEKLDRKVIVPNQPQITGALGAALIAIKKIQKLNSTS